MDHIVVTVNGLARPLPGIAAHTTLLDWLRNPASPVARKAAPRASAARAPFSAAQPTRTAARRGPPSPRASFRSPRSTDRKSSPQRASALPKTCTRFRRSLAAVRRLAMRVLHPGLRVQHGIRVLPPRPRRGGADAGDGDSPRRAWPQRLRPARAQRQPLPLHRLPPDPRRRLRTRRPECGRSPRRSARPNRLPALPTDPGARRPLRASRNARRDPRRCATSPSPSWWPVQRTGASTSTFTGGGRRSWSRSTGFPSCATLSVGDEFVDIGAAVTLSEVERFLAGRVPLLAELFPQFGSRLIRNRATIGGNLGTASPVGDTPPALLALDARVVLASVDGEREVELSEYFTGYRTDRAQARRAHPHDSHPASAGGAHRVSQDRQAPLRRHLECRGGFRSRRGDGVVPWCPDRPWRCRRDAVPRSRHRGDTHRKAMDREFGRGAASCSAAEGTPMSDHRASAEYRSSCSRRPY